ncbi:MAG: hypothetical protein KAU44_02615, partial [Candidatus Marinimicrobia bacterium]|nr:hypothetical protein [Candidatus Neomarinimicrobiota bacterium]
AITIGLAFPMLFMMNIPTMFFADNILKGWWVALGLLLAYTVILFVIWRITGAFKFKKQLD